MHAYKTELGHPAQPSFPFAQFAAYHSKHLETPFTFGDYGFKELSALVEIVSDTVVINDEGGCMEPQLSQNIGFEHFVKQMITVSAVVGGSIVATSPCSCISALVSHWGCQDSIAQCDGLREHRIASGLVPGCTILPCRPVHLALQF